MEKQATSLRSLQELLAAQHKQDAGVVTINRERAYVVPVELIDVYPERNIRPLNQAAIREYADAMKRGDSFPPIQVVVENNRIVVKHGYHRALAAKLAVSEGHEMAGLQVTEFRGNSADAIFLMLNSENSVPVDAVSRAEAYLKLHNQNFTNQQIADRCGKKSAEHVAQMLLLAEAEEEVKALVRADKISATVVIDKIRDQRAGGRNHLDVCREMIDIAERAGKAKATQKHSPAAGPAPKKLPLKAVRSTLSSLSTISNDLRAALDEHALNAFVSADGQGETSEAVTLTLPASKIAELVQLLELVDPQDKSAEQDGGEAQEDMFNTQE